MTIATQVFGRDGFQGASMRKIAAELGITAPTLYYYFESKQDLVWAIIGRGLADFECSCAQALALSEDPVEQISEHVKAHVRHTYQQRDFVQMMDLFFISVSQAPNDIHSGVETMARHVLSPEHAEHFTRSVSDLLRGIAQIIDNGVKSGAFQVDHLELATAGVIILPDRAMRWVQPSALLTVEDIAEQQARLVLRMLGAQVV